MGYEIIIGVSRYPFICPEGCTFDALNFIYFVTEKAKQQHA